MNFHRQIEHSRHIEREWTMIFNRTFFSLFNDELRLWGWEDAGCLGNKPSLDQKRNLIFVLFKNFRFEVTAHKGRKTRESDFP